MPTPCRRGELRQFVVEIGLDAVDPAREPCIESPGSKSAEELPRRVDARDLGSGEPLCEGAGDDPRPATGIDDVGDGRGVDTCRRQLDNTVSTSGSTRAPSISSESAIASQSKSAPRWWW